MSLNDHLIPGDQVQVLNCWAFGTAEEAGEGLQRGFRLHQLYEGTYCIVLDVAPCGSSQKGRVYKVLANVGDMGIIGWIRGIDMFAPSREPPT